MKKLFTAGCVLFAVACFAQADSARKQIAYSAGLSGGGGLMPGIPEQVSYYDGFIGERTLFPSFDFHATVLFKEKFGFRITAGKVGRKTTFHSYGGYDQHINPDFHSLPEYSDMEAGFTYAYILPQAVYRIGNEPFNLTIAGGAGAGRLSMPAGSVIIQRDGRNLFFHIAYDSPVVTNINSNLQLEFAYMRQLSQHLFMNAGVYAGGLMIASNYKYSVTSYENGTSPVYTELEQAKHIMMVYTGGLFLDFQWNKRESPRAYYE